MKPTNTVQDYKVAQIKLKLDQVSVIDKIHLHKQTWEVIFSDLVQSSTNINKLKGQISKLERKFMQEKV